MEALQHFGLNTDGGIEKKKIRPLKLPKEV
jgi:hypothetical protein